MEDDRLVGTLVADRYRVGKKLGEGGMGLVYLAVHEALHKQVALKVLATMGRHDREAVARFEREAIAAANLKHPNIAEAADFGQLPDGGLFLVMEYVEGTTLRRLLAEQGKLAPDRALAILQQVASALATAHARDVVHRDLKPENVIVTRPSESSAGPSSDVVKVIDFGLAKLRSATFGGGGTGLTSAGTVFGTPAYMSPEQVMGQPVDSRADQYALGVLAFELLTGRPPFHADDVGQLMMMHVGAPVPSAREQAPALSPEVDAVTAKMLAKLPDERFGSVAEAMRALSAALSLPPSARQSPAQQLATVIERPRAPDPVRAATLATTLPSPGTDVAPRVAPERVSVVVAVAAGIVVALIALAFVLLRSRANGLSPELTAALSDWRDGNFDTAGVIIAKEVASTPALAEVEAVWKPLADSAANESARAALGKLFETTAIGHSREIASALADVVVADEPKGRDSALVLLRGRHGLLAPEQGARVRLRDADKCDALEAARKEIAQVGTTATQRDLDRLALSECKTMLRVGQLCSMCMGGAPVVEKGTSRGAVAPPPPPPPPAKGRPKGHGKK